ncbi:hypothetical protein [Lutimonas zeaxanthinifaciens]|uniref:hypothetical protein n=1 Tax=Lutimonas zeaxanthinifaciens TaxID=3060215 RepID=UPI00265D5C99|nr:hypothetical protein [Lutimonas sp. YSD2104]WKK65256.1 hypothetical protein QZH61_11765 [Lutimonas sp. YSD2104]
MKANINLSIHLFLWLFLTVTSAIYAQVKSDFKKSKTIYNEVIVNGSPQQVWKVLQSYGEVSNFNATIDESYMLNEGTGVAVLGAEREIHIPNGINNIINKERIVAFVDGVYFTYDVYDTENFPTRQMEVTYGVRRNRSGQTVLFSRTEYEMNNYLTTSMLKGKLKKSNFDSLLSFKDYIETGEMNTDLKELRRQYDQKEREETDFAIRLDPSN